MAQAGEVEDQRRDDPETRVDEQGQDQICSEMALTETQFRLMKSRAKARFGELGKKKLVNKSLHALYLRTSGSVSH